MSGGSTSLLLIAAVGGALVVAVVMAGFVHLERSGRREVVVAMIAVAMLGQLAMYSADTEVPVGPFRPGPLRLPELIIVAALLARAWCARPGSLSATGTAWAGFFAWYAAAAFMGFGAHHNTSEVLFNGKFIAYAGGGYLLASGIRVTGLAWSRVLAPSVAALSAFVTVQLAVTVTKVGVPLIAPVGADAASVYLAIAVVVLLFEAVAIPTNVLRVIAVLPLAAAPLVIGQRASVVHFAATCVVLGGVMMTRTWRRRTHVRVAPILVGAVAFLAIVGVSLLPGSSRGNVVPSPVTAAVNETFGGVGKKQSAAARTSAWAVGVEQVRQQPIFGHGLGIRHRYFQPGVWNTGEFLEGNTFDNIVLDLLVRSGLIGFGLFVVAVGFSIRDGAIVWRRHSNRSTAALGLACTVILVGVLSKGIVESVFEKVTLACLIGLVLGVIEASRSEVAHETRASSRLRERSYRSMPIVSMSALEQRR